MMVMQSPDGSKYLDQAANLALKNYYGEQQYERGVASAQAARETAVQDRNFDAQLQQQMIALKKAKTPLEEAHIGAQIKKLLAEAGQVGRDDLIDWAKLNLGQEKFESQAGFKQIEEDALKRAELTKASEEVLNDDLDWDFRVTKMNQINDLTNTGVMYMPTRESKWYGGVAQDIVPVRIPQGLQIAGKDVTGNQLINLANKYKIPVDQLIDRINARYQQSGGI